ncbi:unnamed protein product [Rhizoctonia solani]|uniref:Uncharacterized protein n=1 Tax=Rhizoctonia solani TaxID=456999 RepID=A0A8H3D3F0_9AGAM|nr:unnamed protein product [Rhizoctonia solani]
MRVSRSGDTVLIPPPLPDYLSAVYNLKPIVGKPIDQDVKAIHAVIQALNAVNHLPTFNNPDLSMQLSQHLFNAQMAVFKASYSTCLMPGDNSVFTPPDLPSHIPGTLKPVVGAPSNEEMKSIQAVLHSVENLANSPQLFDADLSMNLSQHMFNLQFARYMYDSSEGRFVLETEPEELCPIAPQPTIGAQDRITPDEAANLQGGRHKDCPPSGVEQAPEPSSELTQLGETIVNAINDASNKSKDVLENMNRILMSMKNDQSTTGSMSKHYHIFKNPLNQKGDLASECGLPHLRYWYYDDTGKFKLWLNNNDTARYLKFFDIGAHLIEGDEEVKVIDGKYDEAEQLLLAQVGHNH